MPNLNLIAESSNNNSSEVTDELCHLLQLVLGCAVNCERKSEYIETIMEMNETTQHMIMTAIQEVNGLLLFLRIYSFTFPMPGIFLIGNSDIKSLIDCSSDYNSV